MPLNRSTGRAARPVPVSLPLILRADVVLVALGFQVFITRPLWAIPSPDLVINFFASTAQLLGLATVVLGGLAASSRRRHGKTGRKGSPWAFRIVLALFLVSLAANLLQFSLNLDERNARLTTNLWRSSQEEGKPVGDVNLKSLSFSDQKKHPRGISTEEIAKITENPEAYNLIDVREPEEVEMGNIRGAWHRRYPDLQADRTGLVQEGKETILLCESGNRSSELVGIFATDDIPCRFMVGGYEKWVAEGRPLENEQPRTGEIRDIPDYPNKLTLLDTPEVLELIEKEGAVFVDVRYPGDFDLGHLPKALNLPMRKMKKDELAQGLAATPRKPIIAPCYDRRSSFFGMVLGLRLHRLGYDFRGRYTVPHEFSAPVKEKEHVAKWKEQQQGKTLFALAAKPLDATLNALDEWTGHLAVAIVLLVIILRVAFLPLTLKSDRDTLVQRKIAPRIREFKAKLADDPGRLARAVTTIQRREGVRPGRNAMASVCQLIVFLLLFNVVNSASKSSTQGMAWIPSLAEADPRYILPVLVSVLIVATLLLNAGKKGFWLTALRVGCGALLLAITFNLPAGDNVYLASNAGLLLLHSRWSKMRFERSEASKRRKSPALQQESGGIVPLVTAHTSLGTGNKAVRLGRIMEEGLPVPDGFVITEAVLGRQKDKLELSKDEHRQLSKMWRRLQAKNVAVRSSGLNEDGAEKSYAGVFESVLNVPYERLLNALDEVYQSMRTARAAAYGGGGEERGAIVVQKMVEAEYAGVLFTEHPGSSGAMLLEMVDGLGETLVSGTATPRTYRFGRVSGQPLDEIKPPIDMAPLIAMGKQVEEAFGRPQDIEWAYAAGRFYVLQARDITRSCTEGAGERPFLERERRRLLDLAERSMSCLGARRGRIEDLKEKPAFAQNEMSELLPRPTPLSLSIMDALWKSGGSTDLACRSLGIPYLVEEDSVPYLSTVFGALYVNRIEERNRLGRAPGVVTAFKLSRQGAEIEGAFKEDFLPPYLEEIRIRESIDPARLRVSELLRLLRQWTDRFIADTYYHAERINLAADFYVKAAKIEIEKRGLDPAALLARIPETVVHQALSLLPAIREGDDGDAERLFIETFGHRAPHDYELSHPRYRESPELVAEIASRAQASSSSLAPAAGQDALPADGVLRAAVERACRFQALKEEAKHHALRDLALIRTLVVEIGSRLELGEGIFHLTLDDVLRLSDQKFLDSALQLIAERRAAAESARGVELPAQISIMELESFEIAEGGKPKAVRRTEALRGTRVSGDKEVVGRARIVRSPEDMKSFLQGEILVARFTNPAWTPLFPIAGGIITEVGGWLSHAAIVAREYGVTAIVGVKGVLDTLEDGELLRLCADGGVERIRRERRSEDRVQISARAALTRQGELMEALVRNLSRTGALIEVKEELSAGQGVSLQIEPDGPSVPAEVIRRNAPGSYAIQFAKPLSSLPPGEGNGSVGTSKS